MRKYRDAQIYLADGLRRRFGLAILALGISCDALLAV